MFAHVPTVGQDLNVKLQSVSGPQQLTHQSAQDMEHASSQIFVPVPPTGRDHVVNSIAAMVYHQTPLVFVLDVVLALLSIHANQYWQLSRWLEWNQL